MTSTADPGYDAWIANLVAGAIDPAEQAMRDKFRALQAAPVRVTRRPAGRHASPAAEVSQAGAAYYPQHATIRGTGDDALTVITLNHTPGW